LNYYNNKSIWPYPNESIAFKAKKYIDRNTSEQFSLIEKRDKIDKTRKDSPLKPAKDAIIINTDNLSLEEVVNKMYVEVKREKL